MQYDQFASAIAADYEMFIAALVGRYLQLMAPGAEFSPRIVSGFQIESSKLITRFAEKASNDVAQYLDSISSGEPVVSAKLRQSRFILALHLIAVKNVADTVMRLKSGNGGLKSLLVGAAGSIGELLQRRLERPSFTSYDSAGRRWQSNKLVKFIARDFAYQTLIDTQASSIEARGYDLAQIVYPDPSHSNYGETISLTGETPDFAVFEAVRDRYFHPNSNAQLTPYV